MKRKVMAIILPKECDKLCSAWFKETRLGIKNGITQYGFETEVEIDEPDTAGQDDSKPNFQKLRHESILGLAEEIIKLQGRLDSLDKLDGLAGLNMRVNTLNERIDAMQGERKKKLHHCDICKKPFWGVDEIFENEICDDCMGKQEATK